MKNFRTALLVIGIVLFNSCNQSTDKSTGQSKPAGQNPSTSTKTQFPYTKNTDRNWDINMNDSNTLIALNALKAIERKDYQAISNVTADSIKSDIDGLKFNGTKAQMMKANKDFFSTLKNIRIVPQDWVSVINKDKSQEWVSVWYTQYWEDLKGKRDSLNVFNDIRLQQGKIVEWDEYIQHFPKP